MKTYSRKNSRYLKKAFIASNFNEMCRLCLSELDLGLTPIFQEFSKISYQEWIRYSVDVLIEEGDGLPSNICEECLVLVERTYLFKKKCQASDLKLREHLESLEVNIEGKLNETGLIDLPEDHKNLFQREEQSKSKCDESSAVDSGGTDNEQSEEKQSEEQQTQEEPPEEESVEPEQPTKAMEDEEAPQPPLPEEELVEEKQSEVPYSDAEFKYMEPQDKVVKRYILKGEKGADGQEEDLTVCEVVPLDVKHDEMSDAEETLTYTTLQCPSQNGHESEYGNPHETKIQEIYQLWDEGEEEQEEEKGKKEQKKQKKQKKQEEQEEQKDQKKIMIFNVSWEDITNKNETTHNTGQVVRNGVIRWAGVIRNKSNPEKTETKVDVKTPTRRRKPVKFTCFACGKDFPKGKKLKSHLFKFHREVSDAAFCNICGKSFVCNNNLKRHMAIHTGYKPHECQICGRTFTQGSILKRHVFTHETLKPFNCEICGKGYTQKMNLLAHVKSHGFKTEGESFSCQYCNKTFLHQSGLSRHSKLHKGVRLTCEYCNRQFDDPSAFARHVRSLHSK